MTEHAYPRSWKFGTDDPLELSEGAYVSTTTAPSGYGETPIINLNVAGEERAVWLATTVLREKFAEELRRRGARDFDRGERITIRRSAEKKTSGTGRPYWPYSVTFHDAPRQDAAALLGVGDSATVPAADSIPF